MSVLLIAILAGLGFLLAYHTYGKWLGRRIFELAVDNPVPSQTHQDGQDYVPTKKSIVFGHHFTSIAGTGPIVGPAIAVIWGWLPALLWVVFGSIFIGAVHDFGSLVVSLRHQGKTVGDIAGSVLNKRVRVLFLGVLFLALTIVIAIFGLVIAAVFKQYPQAITPCVIQVPIAIGIGLWLHRKGVDLKLPAALALGVMYLTVVFGDWGPLHTVNETLAGLPMIAWVGILLAYSYVASVLPVWTLLQPRDFINSLQLLSALALIVIGLVVAAFIGGAPPVEGADRQPLELAAPMIREDGLKDLPLIFPFLFITVACGAISGFHCLVSSGTSSKQLMRETDARFVGFGSMLTEGFLAIIVILACVAGLGLGMNLHNKPGGIVSGISATDGFAIYNSESGELDHTYVSTTPPGNPKPSNGQQANSVYHLDFKAIPNGQDITLNRYELDDPEWLSLMDRYSLLASPQYDAMAVIGPNAYQTRYDSWSSANGLAAKVGAFVDGAGNFLKAIGIPAGWAVALMGVFVASFAGTTLDTATRLQRYVIQELARCFVKPRIDPEARLCPRCGYDRRGAPDEPCPECGCTEAPLAAGEPGRVDPVRVDTGRLSFNPLTWFTTKHGATALAVITGGALAAMPAPGRDWTWETSGGGGLILWPMFGATNQLLGGLAFLVITFWLLRMRKPVWFVVLPLLFMLVMPAWALYHQMFVQGVGMASSWLEADNKNWALIAIAAVTLALEVWMIVEALVLWPKVKRLGEDGALAGDP